jgi:hypothetical protein
MGIDGRRESARLVGRNESSQLMGGSTAERFWAEESGTRVPLWSEYLSVTLPLTYHSKKASAVKVSVNHI